MATISTDQPGSVESPSNVRKRRPIFRYILLGLLAAFLVLVGVIATRPDDFSVTRSATMTAPPEAVFAQLNDFHSWEAWSPWAKMDPNAKGTYEGPTTGEGAIFHWDGNNDVGAGSMEIVESRPSELVKIKLDFIRPFVGSNDVNFTIKPISATETSLEWAMSGKNNFIAKAIGLVIDCDKMIGDQFEKGLANMKSIVEAPPKN